MTDRDDREVNIPNHLAPTLSDLDLRMARSIPPGGNWQDIPEDIPSKRVQNIRESYRNGGGSRSTYYGRLKPDAPSYTINTYFNRVGNGCHLHYDYEGGQHRVLSHREAARLQSFPDSFVFTGGRGKVENQIGNAVPPVLAYFIASTLADTSAAGTSGQVEFVDLFCGAGGLSLGLKWAGWSPIVANDKEDYYTKTYRKNIHDEVVLGDIRDDEIMDEVVTKAEDLASPNSPTWVVGGPPCQGFSTAGNRRSMEDQRNWLFKQFKQVIETLEPDGFIFENVTGLRNMANGRALEVIEEELDDVVDDSSTWTLQSEEFAVPQRRTRLFIVGVKGEDESISPPTRVTRFQKGQSFFENSLPAVTVAQAIGDLPALEPDTDGSHLEYAHEPEHPYQAFMRGHIDVGEYIEELREWAGRHRAA